MAKKYIHVNQHKIRSNKKNNMNEPVITIKEGRTNTYVNEIEILGPCRIRYSGNDKPILSCGARVVIETTADYKIIQPEDWVKMDIDNDRRKEEAH
jgi:hypothetical protein